MTHLINKCICHKKRALILLYKCRTNYTVYETSSSEKAKMGVQAQIKQYTWLTTHNDTCSRTYKGLIYGLVITQSNSLSVVFASRKICHQDDHKKSQHLWWIAGSYCDCLTDQQTTLSPQVTPFSSKIDNSSSAYISNDDLPNNLFPYWNPTHHKHSEEDSICLSSCSFRYYSGFHTIVWRIWFVYI